MAAFPQSGSSCLNPSASDETGHQLQGDSPTLFEDSVGRLGQRPRQRAAQTGNKSRESESGPHWWDANRELHRRKHSR